MLETLEIETSRDGNVLLGPAPQIRQLTWKGSELERDLRSRDFRNLRNMTMAVNMPFEDCARVLQQCHNLEQLDVTILPQVTDTFYLSR
jgi:hypothetical protein